MLKPICESSFIYKQHRCIVLFMPLGFRCGYVAISKGSPYYEVDYHKIDIICHGGLTFSDYDLSLSQNQNDTWWLGFDCAHYHDLIDVAAGDAYYKDNQEWKTLKEVSLILQAPNEGFRIMRKEMVENGCKDIVDQLLELEKSEEKGDTKNE